MFYKQNLHTHTKYCDGLDTPEELIIEAINKGFNSIGFSGHSFTYFNPKSYAMTKDNELKYKQEIRELQKKYKGIIDVYLGLELERYSDVDISEYDYIIGSVHYIFQNNMYLGVDYSAQKTKEIIEKYFNNDGLLFAKAYYETVFELSQCKKIDIIGHFDLVTKHLEKENLFDTDSSKYKSYALESLHAIAKYCKIFEVNTGAIARGYRTTPYPSPFIMRELYNIGCNVVLT